MEPKFHPFLDYSTDVDYGLGGVLDGGVSEGLRVDPLLV